MAKAREIPHLAEAQSFRQAAAMAVEVRAEEVFEHADGVLDTSEIEGVHRMRVATRRLRAALELFEPCFPRKPHKRTLKEVKRLADALGERRDRDVAIERLTQFAQGLDVADRAGVDVLIARLREEQLAANAELEAFVEEERIAALCAQLQGLVEAAEHGAATAA